jgi:hypothetical protein
MSWMLVQKQVAVCVLEVELLGLVSEACCVAAGEAGDEFEARVGADIVTWSSVLFLSFSLLVFGP